MKFQSRFSILLVTLLVAIFCTTTSAQSNKELLFKVSVPFDFVAGDARLPAGHYSVYHVSTKSMILVESEAGKGASFVQVGVASLAAGEHLNALVFNRYGERYFLSQITTKNDHEVHTCSKGRDEQILIAQREKPGKQTVSAGY